MSHPRLWSAQHFSVEVDLFADAHDRQFQHAGCGSYSARARYLLFSLLALLLHQYQWRKLAKCAQIVRIQQTTKHTAALLMKHTRHQKKG
jgi:hypothetical protein